MTFQAVPFLTESFLLSIWAKDFEKFLGSEEEEKLIRQLKNWRDRKGLKETSSEEAFLRIFFKGLWGYWSSGDKSRDQGYTLYPKYPVPGAGAGGKTGEADLVLGYFELDHTAATPQVLCEFKDIRSVLDAPQKRKGDNRSPVEQCKDYLWNARKGFFGNEAIIPTWGFVSDMNEFRLYWWDRMPHQYISFRIEKTDLFSGPSLLDLDEEASFRRFLFKTIFHSETLLTKGGKSLLERLIARQRFREKEIENEFYREYKNLRQRLFKVLIENNPEFPGTKGQLLHLAQRILDRFLFIFYCEDMGQTISFPPQLLRDVLIGESQNQYFDPDGSTVWETIKSLFNRMNVGGIFPPEYKINQFNGGLFEEDQTLNTLKIPNKIFCERHQGENDASLNTYKNNFLYFSAAYNYADKGSTQKTLGLYTLGRIFEQSITELEIMAAEAEGRESLNKLSKRKTDGVYYTPENVVEKIVEETLEPLLDELKAASGWKKGKEPSAKVLEKYLSKVRNLKVVDPACGSGAFLITAFRFLKTELLAIQNLLRKKNRRFHMRDEAEIIENILARNLYGVDISPSSVEITRLALWLHTARPGKTLASLNTHIKVGNSLIDSTFYNKRDLLDYSPEEKERIQAFDWWKNFPKVKEQGGFDAVFSNPPYVKLQNFKKIHPDMDEFLRMGRPASPGFESTQTGNYDLYLPFIEKGLSLLNEHGRMGFIAPSLWLVNDYGRGLRRLIHKEHALDRWVDFGAHQVFAEGTTYTALQFYSRRLNDHIRLVQAPGGNISALNWDLKENWIPYQDLHLTSPWNLLPKPDRDLIAKLGKTCRRLDDPEITKSVYQGLITSADAIYHLKRLGPQQYLCTPAKKEGAPYEVKIEDEIMKPLVSGEAAKRYVEPDTRTYLLFPYRVNEGKAELIPENEMAKDYPKAWAYLKSYERKLRERESSKFDDNEWYRFGRHQNLEKQEIKKLIVPRLVAQLQIYFDDVGKYFLDNVDVGGIAPTNKIDPYFLLAALNGPVCNFVFRRISKPFRGDYRSANKQFITPLPIPKLKKDDIEKISALAKNIQHIHTTFAAKTTQLKRRFETLKGKQRSESWLFPEIPEPKTLAAFAPPYPNTAKKRKWAQEQRAEALEAKYAEIEAAFHALALLEAELADGELIFKIDGKNIIDRVFVDRSKGRFLLAQWRTVARTFPITEKAKAKNLCTRLRQDYQITNPATAKQIIELDEECSNLRKEIRKKEEEMNALLFKAYNLTADEIALVRGG